MIRCARATGSRVCTQQYTHRGSSLVVLLTLWETLRYRVSIRKIRRKTPEGSFTIPAPSTHKSNAQGTRRLSFSERSRSQRNSCFPLGYSPARGSLRPAPEEVPGRRNKFDGNLVLPDTTDTRKVPMQPTEDNRAKYSRSLVNTTDKPKYRETDERNNALPSDSTHVYSSSSARHSSEDQVCSRSYAQDTIPGKKHEESTHQEQTPSRPNTFRGGHNSSLFACKSNTKPARASFALGMAAQRQKRSNEFTQGRHEPAVPELLPKSLDELISSDPVPNKGHLVQQLRFNPSKLWSPQQIILFSSLLNSPKVSLEPQEDWEGTAVKNLRESIDGVMKLFFHTHDQHLCLLLQFHCPLLLLCLLFPLLILRIMLLQQFLRFLDLLLFPPPFPPRRAGGRH